MLVSQFPKFAVDAAYGRDIRVKWSSSGIVTVAGDEEELGTTEEITNAASEKVSVMPKNMAGVRYYVAAGVINEGADVYTAAAGKVASTGTYLRGVALEAASGSGSRIKVFGFSPPAASSVVTLTGTQTLTNKTLTAPKIAVIDMTSGTTGSQYFSLTDNLADALSFKESTTAYLTFVTTNSGEKVWLGKALDATVSVTTPSLLLTGTTGNQTVTLTTNLADALSIVDGAGDLIVVTTTTGSQLITITPATTVTGLITSNGGITLSGAVDFTFTGTSGQCEMVLTTNLADALSIRDSAGDLIVFTTTTGTPAVTITPATTVTGLLTSNGGITISGAVPLTFTGTTGQPSIVLTKNLADSLSIINGDVGDLAVIKTTTNAVEIDVAKEVVLQLGAYASAYATGSATVFTSAKTAVGRFYGESTSDLTSAVNARTIVGRHLIVTSSGTVNHETYGMIGQVCVKNTTLGHLHAGVMGTLEVSDAATINGSYTYGAAGVIASLGTGTSITTATKAVCGFSAFLNGEALASGNAFAYATDAVGSTNWNAALAMSKCDNLFYAATGTAYESGIKIASITGLGSGASGLARVKVGSTSYYIALYAAGDVTGE